MKNIRHCCGYLLMAIACIAFGYFLKLNFYQSKYSDNDFFRFEKVLRTKQIKLDFHLKELKYYILNNEIDDLFYEEFYHLYDLYKEEGLAFLIYKNDSLEFWSSNAMTIPEIPDLNLERGALYDLGNAFYLSQPMEEGEYQIIGLIKIKNHYPITNEYLRNTFQESFQLSPEISVIDEQCSGCYQIENKNGDFLFALDPGNLKNMNPVSFWFIVILYASGIFFLLLFIRTYMNRLKSGRQKHAGIMLSVLGLFAIRFIMIKTGIFSFFENLELFKPGIYASSNFLPSLGDMLINSIFIFFVFYLFYQEFQFIKPLEYRKRIYVSLIFLFVTIFLVLYYIFTAFLFENLIINSNISFEAHKVLEINVYSFIGLFCIGLHFAAFSLFSDKIVLLFRDEYTKKSFLVYLFIMSTLIFIVVSIFKKLDIFIVILFYVLVFVFTSYRYSKKPGYKYSRLVFLVVLFSLYSVYFILINSAIKEKNNKKVLAVNLASEHDPIAELLFSGIGRQLSHDEFLAEVLFSGFTIEEVYSYVSKKYFSGYFNKYDIQITVCNPYDSVLIEPDDELFHCYDFFEKYVFEKGIKIPDTYFYFLNDLNGRIGYFGIITYYNEQTLREVSLFVEMQSKLITEELGYPELLLSYEQDKNKLLREYSYAKYYQNELITQSGDYPYSLKIKHDHPEKRKFCFSRENNYSHLLYHADGENTIVISTPVYTFFDVIISFSYIFLFYFVTITLYTLINNLPLLGSSFVPTFRNRIQFTMIFILFISLLLIGGVTIYLSVSQYQNKHYEIIGEKIQSVYIELIHKLEFEESLDRGWHSSSYENLDALLRKFSNVFYTDINLYDASGILLATSRPEVFRKKMIGNKMNPEAYYQLTQKNSSEFIHNEKIGRLEYLSGYVPFTNNENKLLAYLNLPYFTKQEAFRREVSTLIVAVVNIYVMILLITISVAFLMSEKITRPLRLIQESFSKIKLGKANEHIRYKGKDEIADLVSEYNRMVVELSKSVEKLARSERESAWREMAKQIAHEIKNPLTPMKLNVQYLQRAWKDKVSNWDDYLERFSKTMIDQINSLSAIATEFSNFAKMPQTKNEVVNIITKVKNTARLFNNLEHIDIDLALNDYDEILVYADKEQLLRVFVNLVKNAVQSIPEDQDGKVIIAVHLDEVKNKVQIQVIDNGRGIEDQMKDRLFQPNFTTKSSGMGLGLAIVKNIIENSGGQIWFETELGKGSVFTVQLPVYKG